MARETGMGDRVPRDMTIAEFLCWQMEQEQRFEFVNGQPVAMAGTRLRHDRMAVNAIAEVRRQLRAIGSPCDAFTADIGIVTPPGHIRRPEVSVLCPPFDEEAMTTGSPRLVVEILSESTARIDRLVKLDEYKAMETMDYIVIADPTRFEVGFWFRDAERVWRNRSGTWHPNGRASNDDSQRKSGRIHCCLPCGSKR